MITTICNDDTTEDINKKLRRFFNKIQKKAGERHFLKPPDQHFPGGHNSDATNKEFDAMRFCGALKFEEDAMALQKRWRDEW